MDIGVWRFGPGRILSRDTGDYRLQVRLTDGAARFLVLRRPDQAVRRPQAVFASGEAEDVRAAMLAAARMAARMEQPPRTERPED